MVSEGDLVAALLDGGVVKDAAPQSRAQAASGLAVGHDRFHYRIGVSIDDAEWHSQLCQVSGQHILGEAGLLLVQIDGKEIEMDRSAALEVKQQRQQRVAVLASAEAHH